MKNGSPSTNQNVYIVVQNPNYSGTPEKKRHYQTDKHTKEIAEKDRRE